MIDRVVFKNIEVSRLGLGNMRLPCKTPEKRESSSEIDYEAAGEIVDAAYKRGVNYFDTAYMYHGGKSEEFIGSALKKYNRSTYYVADKLPIWFCKTESDMEKIFETQLKRTKLEYFDFYLLHSLDDDNFNKCEQFGAYDFISRKKDEGKIKYLGFSFHGTISCLEKIIEVHKWDFAQIQLNYLDWENQNAKTQYALLTQAGIPVIVMEPVRGGKLAVLPENQAECFKNINSKRSCASWAIRFASGFDNVITVLSGMNSLEQLDDNINTLTSFKPLSSAELSACKKVAAMINESDIIPCTGCDYCIDCPKKIKISTVFDIYNRFKKSIITKSQAVELYNNIDCNASLCIACGACKNHCPQSIDIPKLMNGTVLDFFG